MKKIFTLVLGLGLSLSAVHAQKDVKLNANNIGPNAIYLSSTI